MHYSIGLILRPHKIQRSKPSSFQKEFQKSPPEPRRTVGGEGFFGKHVRGGYAFLALRQKMIIASA